MAYSVQQIKFELLSYVKEFGADFTEWSIGTATDAPKALFDQHGVDAEKDPWLWKPALTPAAAHMIKAWMVERQKARDVSEERGPHVFLFKHAGREGPRR